MRLSSVFQLYTFLSLVPIVVAQVEEGDLTSQALVLSTEKDVTYRFGVGGTRKPFNFENEDGNLTGFDTDIVDMVCSEAKKSCYTVLARKEDCIFTDRNIDYAGSGLMSEALQGCVGYQITRDRQNEFTFTVPYLVAKSTYSVTPDNPKDFSSNLSDLTKFRLVQASGSPFNAACLTRLGKTFRTILVATTITEAKQMLLNGTADVLLSTRANIPGLQVLPSDVHCDEGRGTGLLLKKGSDIPLWWNPAMSRLRKAGTYDKMCRAAVKKYGDSIHCLSSRTNSNDLSLINRQSANQQRSGHLWKFVVSGRIAPYSFINKTGELVGFTKDFILNVCKIAGKNCALLLAEVSECSVRVGELLYPGRGLMSGWFDACTGYFSTVDRRNSWDFTDPYLVSNASFYVAPGNPANFNPNHQNLSSYTIAYQATAITNDHCLHRLHKKVGRLLVFSDAQLAVNAVLNGKADAMFTKLILSKDQGLLRLPERFHCENVGTSVMVRKGSELPTWWNKAFRKFIHTGKYQQFCKEQAKQYKSKN